MTKYNANSIRILSDEELRKSQAFDWVYVEELAHKHNKPKDWIERSIKACRECNIEPSYFVDKYILKKTLGKDERLEEQSRRLQFLDSQC